MNWIFESFSSSKQFVKKGFDNGFQPSLTNAGVFLTFSIIAAFLETVTFIKNKKIAQYEDLLENQSAIPNNTTFHLPRNICAIGKLMQASADNESTFIYKLEAVNSDALAAIYLFLENRMLKIRVPALILVHSIRQDSAIGKLIHLKSCRL